jgi:predicted GH43/DUF377 family glycosyl hydrolase
VDIFIKRHPVEIIPDNTRVICEFFRPGQQERILRIIERVSKLSETEAQKQFDMMLKLFSARHKNFQKILESHFHKNLSNIPELTTLSDLKKNLISAYCSREYSFESAALMNPSIVPAPGNRKKQIMSLRQVGEGHISSIGFREICLDDNGSISVEPAGQFSVLPEVNVKGDSVYHSFSEDTLLSERIIFPATPDECNGMEDARFVLFADGLYYATYTAYDGHRITIKLIQTEDFLRFKIDKLQGKAAANKGMSLFPEKVNNQFAMISRLDGENLYYTTSPDIYHWESAVLLDTPAEPWEFVQTGNCGSPLKTEQGWILLTHGVGPMRQYVMSAILLDLATPAKVIGRLKNPLLVPTESEREGYVPNVVYSCGSLIVQDQLIIPYAMSDYRTGIASVDVHELLSLLI